MPLPLVAAEVAAAVVEGLGRGGVSPRITRPGAIGVAVMAGAADEPVTQGGEMEEGGERGGDVKQKLGCE